MIRTRLLNLKDPEDRNLLDGLRDTYPDQLKCIDGADIIFIAQDESGKVLAAVGSSPVQLIHDFLVVPSDNMVIARRAAEALVRFAMGVGRGLSEREAVFVVDKNNEHLVSFVEDTGAISDGPPASLYVVKLS